MVKYRLRLRNFVDTTLIDNKCVSYINRTMHSILEQPIAFNWVKNYGKKYWVKKITEIILHKQPELIKQINSFEKIQDGATKQKTFFKPFDENSMVQSDEQQVVNDAQNAVSVLTATLDDLPALQAIYNEFNAYIENYITDVDHFQLVPYILENTKTIDLPLIAEPNINDIVGASDLDIWNNDILNYLYIENKTLKMQENVYWSMVDIPFTYEIKIDLSQYSNQTLYIVSPNALLTLNTFNKQNNLNISMDDVTITLTATTWTITANDHTDYINSATGFLDTTKSLPLIFGLWTDIGKYESETKAKLGVTMTIATVAPYLVANTDYKVETDGFTITGLGLYTGSVTFTWTLEADLTTVVTVLDLGKLAFAYPTSSTKNTAVLEAINTLNSCNLTLSEVDVHFLSATSANIISLATGHYYGYVTVTWFNRIWLDGIITVTDLGFFTTEPGGAEVIAKMNQLNHLNLVHGTDIMYNAPNRTFTGIDSYYGVVTVTYTFPTPLSDVWTNVAHLNDINVVRRWDAATDINIKAEVLKAYNEYFETELVEGVDVTTALENVLGYKRVKFTGIGLYSGTYTADCCVWLYLSIGAYFTEAYTTNRVFPDSIPNPPIVLEPKIQTLNDITAAYDCCSNLNVQNRLQFQSPGIAYTGLTGGNRTVYGPDYQGLEAVSHVDDNYHDIFMFFSNYSLKTRTGQSGLGGYGGIRFSDIRFTIWPKT